VREPHQGPFRDRPGLEDDLGHEPEEPAPRVPVGDGDVVAGPHGKAGPLRHLSQEGGDESEDEDAFTEEWAVIYQRVDRAILKLSAVRRAVWMAYRDLGYSATIEELLAVLQATRPERHWTENSVRRARQEGRKKLRAFLGKFLKKRG